MAKYSISYVIFKNGEVQFESEVEVSFTKKDIAEMEEFIKEHDYSWEFVDIPAHMYDKCMAKAVDTAIREYPEYAKDGSDMTVVLPDVIAPSLLDQLSEETREKVYENIPDEYFDEEEGDEEPEEELVPTKENTLYLTIKQSFFDQIIAGTKKEEYREIKDTTYKKYLECDENGYPIWFTAKMSEDNPLAGEIYIWNNGDYPYVPKYAHEFLNLAVGYNKERDTAIVEITDITFEPMKTREGKDARFKDDGQHWIFCDDGDMCMWNIVYHLGKVVELHRKGE